MQFWYLLNMEKGIIRKKIGFRHFKALRYNFKVPASATPNEIDRELVRKKSLGFWMGRDLKLGIAKSC